jgi:uncharacterized membrane protein
MDLSGVLKVVHAFLGAWLIAALVGRWVTLMQAGRSKDIGAVQTLLSLSDRFERWVIRIPLYVLIFGIATAIAQGRPFLGPLQGGHVDWLFVSLIVYLSILPVVPLVFLPRGRRFAAALEAATAAGRVTDALTREFHDRIVFAGHAYELGAILVVFALMITKPF